MTSCVFAWKIPWTEEPSGLQSMESQKSWTRLSNFNKKQSYAATQLHSFLAVPESSTCSTSWSPLYSVSFSFSVEYVVESHYGF